MSEPTFWRTEVWHPLSVHMPLALLLFATLLKLVSLVLKPSASVFWRRAASLLLYVGTLCAWVSIYTGDLADGIVSRTLCDPTVLKRHELAAYNTAYFYSGATLLSLAQHYPLPRPKALLLGSIIAVLMLAGAYFMVRAGHLGAEVVYQQAGGVQVPTADCAAFE